MKRKGFSSGLIALLCLIFSMSLEAQTATQERAFRQSKAEVEKALKALQSFTSGRLPTLDGFAVSGDRSLDRFQRGFYQCEVQVSPRPGGGSVVRVSTKITAWYNGATSSESGYQVLASNGRLESDLLDRLSEALGGEAASAASPMPVKPEPQRSKTATSSAKSSPAPGPAMPDAPSSAASARAFRPAAAPEPEVPSVATQRAVADRHLESLRTEAKNLEEIFRNQSHPTNLVAVRSGKTPVLAEPNEGGKVLFLASAEDEFEMIDLNNNWVHVRISGLSRGWIRRNSVEVNGEPVPEAAPVMPPVPAPVAKTGDQPRFVVEHEETASFPATWEPLRGKTVKIVSVQPALPTGGDSQAKLDFAKSLFRKEYAELAENSSTAAGIVVIFDSADGGMLAAPLPVLRQWKEGTLSDEALWRRCYVDPPEMMGSVAAR